MCVGPTVKLKKNRWPEMQAASHYVNRRAMNSHWKHQAPTSKLQTRNERYSIGDCMMRIGASLELGPWCLGLGSWLAAGALSLSASESVSSFPLLVVGHSQPGFTLIQPSEVGI